jgi:hypothetical protein
MRRQGVGGLAAAGLMGLAGVAAAALGWVRCPLAALYHIPCPGCGMTRAVLLMASGRVEASLRMNALALPTLAAGIALSAVALQSARRRGAGGPTRLARVAITSSVVVYAAALTLWALRWFGLFGGPVPV